MNKEPKFKEGDEVWCVSNGGLISAGASLSVFRGVIKSVFWINGDVTYRIGDEHYYEESLFADIREALVSIKYDAYDELRQYVLNLEEAIKNLEKQIKEQEEEKI